MWKWSGTITSKREVPRGKTPHLCAREKDLPQMSHKSTIFQFTQKHNNDSTPPPPQKHPNRPICGVKCPSVCMHEWPVLATESVLTYEECKHKNMRVQMGLL